MSRLLFLADIAAGPWIPLYHRSLPVLFSSTRSILEQGKTHSMFQIPDSKYRKSLFYFRF